MDSSLKNPITPRRSQRIQRAREPSPAPEETSMNVTRGPRSMAKLKKAQRDLNKTTDPVSEISNVIEVSKVNNNRKSLPAKATVQGEATEDSKIAEAETLQPVQEKVNENKEPEVSSSTADVSSKPSAHSGNESKRKRSRRGAKSAAANGTENESLPLFGSTSSSSGDDQTTILANDTNHGQPEAGAVAAQEKTSGNESKTAAATGEKKIEKTDKQDSIPAPIEASAVTEASALIAVAEAPVLEVAAEASVLKVAGEAPANTDVVSEVSKDVVIQAQPLAVVNEVETPAVANETEPQPPAAVETAPKAQAAVETAPKAQAAVETAPKPSAAVEIEPKPSAAIPSAQPSTSTENPQSNDEKKEVDLNVTPNLMDESIISVFDSPPPASVPPKDSTFSPIVDTSINDSRPTIDELNTTPSLTTAKSAKLRTSTPLVQKVLLNAGGAGTPKRASAPKSTLPMSSLAKTPMLAEKFGSEELSDEASKPNLLEKSILKSSRRRRSKSVADVEMGSKRVMFNSPQFMEIDTIDERMMQSFIGERENSVIVPAVTPKPGSVGTPKAVSSVSVGSARRKRSLSTGTPIKAQDPIKSQERQSRSRKMPDFKAIHKQQFEKMESIAEHQARKNERAKKLATPEAKLKPTPEVKQSKIPQPSKIPMGRKPLANAASTQNAGKSRVLKRSLSAYEEEPARKRVQLMAPVSNGPSTSSGNSGSTSKKIAVSGLQRTKSESASAWTAPPTTVASLLGSKKPATSSAIQKSSQVNRSKIEERREKNMSLYKTNQIQKSAADHRQKNNTIIKGVRLNRRFELMMQNRRDHEEV